MASMVSPRPLLTAATTVVALITLAPAPAAASPHGYRVVDLGTLSGGDGAATAMNDRGDIVGWSTVASGARHAVLWRHGVITDLGVLPGDTDSAAVDVNEFGDVAITSFGSDYLTRAVLWRDGRLHDLGTLGGENSVAIGVNDRRQVLGTSEPAGEMPHRFLWRNGVFTDLGREYFYEFTTDVNNAGRRGGRVQRAAAGLPVHLRGRSPAQRRLHPDRQRGHRGQQPGPGGGRGERAGVPLAERHTDRPRHARWRLEPRHRDQRPG